jgi:hypothetical protein
MPINSERVVVLAATLREFHAWCRANGRSPRDPRVMYAVGPHVLRAITGARVVRHGSWWERPDGVALAAAAAAIEERAARGPLADSVGQAA